MQIQVEKQQNGRVSARFIGEMSIFYADELKQKLLSQLSDIDELEINLSDVTEIDTAGLQILMAMKNEAQAKQRQLILTQHSQAVVDLLDLSQLTGFFGDPILLHGKPDKKIEEQA